MSDRDTLDRMPHIYSHCSRTVLCPKENIPADIMVTKWELSDGRWTSWTVTDCSLLPAGEIWCLMDCLSQMDTLLD